MLALLRFHAVVGVRVAVRSFAPLFCAILAAVMLQMYPEAMVLGLARALFSNNPPVALLLAFGGLSFLLSCWAAGRLTLGLNGWLRHLAPSDLDHRRGLELALLSVQTPLAITLALLMIVAATEGFFSWRPVLFQVLVLFAAGTMAGLPVRRRWLTVPAALTAGLLSAVGSWRTALPALALLALAEVNAGPLRRVQQRTHRRMGLPFGVTISLRALGFRTAGAYAAASVPAIGAWLFVGNNGLRGEPADGAFRFGFSVAVAVYLALASESLAVRRPSWPWARSLPWSCRRRVAEDAVLLASAALPGLLACGCLNRRAALTTLLLLPTLALRAAGHMRRIRERRLGTGTFFPEACLAAAIVALVPVTQWLAPASAVAALETSRRAEMNQKVTRWLEFHHAAGGDSQWWSEE